jgi:4-amino-4-deoxy-L-arabinose transferase-like glycosyltransferase
MTRRLLVPLGMTLVLGGVYWATLLPGVGHIPDTAGFQFTGYRLCVSHWTGYPTYHLISHAFTTLLPFGSPAFRANLLSAVFAVLACLVLRRLLLRLGVRDPVATATALAFGFTPTFWRNSITAEVYSLHILFVVLVADGLVRWRQTGRRRDLILACGVYAFSFGNHLMTVLLLPAVAAFVLAVRPRVLLDWRSVLPVSGLVVVASLQYLYPVWRSLDPTTPYLAAEVTSLDALWDYATGGPVQGSMFAFTAAELVRERIPFFLREWWTDCGPLLLLAILGVARVRDRAVVLFLGLAFLGSLVFALGLKVGEIDPYFLPGYLVTAVVAGLGLDTVVARAGGRRAFTLLVFLLPAGLSAFHWTRVQEATLPGKAEPMKALLAEVRDGALLIPRYEEYMQLLYFDLAEGRAGPSVFVGFEVPVEDVVAYLEQDEPVYLPRVRRWVPPRLPVYDMRLRLRPRYKAAGLKVEMGERGVYRISRGTARESP